MSGSLPYGMKETGIEYRYDGTLPGFYTVLYHAVHNREMPLGIVDANDAPSSLLPQRFIQTDGRLSDRVRNSVVNRISQEVHELLETVFLSCMEQKEMALFRFLLLGYQTGKNLTDRIGHPLVSPVLNAARHLYGEVHLLKGFIRFSDYQGILGATITPKNFVLPFLAGHFCARLPNEAFVIFDKVHGAALIYQRGRREILPMEEMTFSDPSPEEEWYRNLWRRFYDTIAIEARTNSRCRMTHMPKRYWANMTEFQGVYEDGTPRITGRGETALAIKSSETSRPITPDV